MVQDIGTFVAARASPYQIVPLSTDCRVPVSTRSSACWRVPVDAVEVSVANCTGHPEPIGHRPRSGMLTARDPRRTTDP